MSMTVRDLRAALADLPDEMLVVMAGDAEGNDHSPLEQVDQAMYVAESTWAGEVYNTPEQLAAKIANEPNAGWDEEEDAAPTEAIRVVLLEPVN